jgi:hypothetical protein
MPVLRLPSLPAKFVRATPAMQPAGHRADPRQCAWLPAPHCTADDLTPAPRSSGAPAATATMSPAAALATERSRPVREAPAAPEAVFTAEQEPSQAYRQASAAQVAGSVHAGPTASSSNGQPTSPAPGLPPDDMADGAPWRVRGRASSYSAPETQQAPALPPPPKLLVFSGGTAFNSVAGAVRAEDPAL